jgi:hypothetical protein
VWATELVRIGSYRVAFCGSCEHQLDVRDLVSSDWKDKIWIVCSDSFLELTFPACLLSF